MKITIWLTFCILFLVISNLCLAQQENVKDFRNVENGYSIYKNGYIDQPYVVVLEDGSWLCVFTTGSNSEGENGQHIMSGKSYDNGKTWTDFINIEPAEGPAASWAMPYLTNFGRVYVFYDYNGDHIKTLNGKPIRHDMLGWYCYKYSDDGGMTWSKRYRLPVRTTSVDRGNDWHGEVKIMWGIGKPVDVDNSMMFGFTKLGKYILNQGEGWFFRSDNINTEKKPDELKWEMLPKGDKGVRNQKFGSVQEEFNLVQMNNGDLYSVYRTRTGYIANSYSRDGGKSWSLPKKAIYSDGSKIKNPRACPRLWKTKNGKYLLWYHNHSGTGFKDRNPVWVTGGVEKNGRIYWSQPEILLYGQDRNKRYSYPDLVQKDGKYWITETNKAKGRVHLIPNSLFRGLWKQFSDSTLTKKGLRVYDNNIHDNKLDISSLLDENKIFKPISSNDGFTIDLNLKFDNLKQDEIIFDSRTKQGSGIYIKEFGYRQIQLGICNSENCVKWSTDPGLLGVINSHHITAILDRPTNIIEFLVDGKLCDGDTARQYGWLRYNENLGEIKSDNTVYVNNNIIDNIRIYSRDISVSESVYNYNYFKNNN